MPGSVTEMGTVVDIVLPPRKVAAQFPLPTGVTLTLAAPLLLLDASSVATPAQVFVIVNAPV